MIATCSRLGSTKATAAILGKLLNWIQVIVFVNLNSHISEYVLQRDGTNVVVNSACTATSGTWYSPYDGATWTAASDVDIDHMVPLKNAWIVRFSFILCRSSLLSLHLSVLLRKLTRFSSPEPTTGLLRSDRRLQTTSRGRNCGL